MMKLTDEIFANLMAAAILDGAKPKQKEEEKDIRTQAKELGETMKQAMLGFMDAGFTEEQAFKIVLTVKEG